MHPDMPRHHRVMFHNIYGKLEDARYRKIADQIDIEYTRGSPWGFRWMYTYQILLASGAMFDDLCGDPIL